MAFIYLIINKINKKEYVGYTNLPSIQERFDKHWQSRYSDKCYFHDALIKYGKENFIISLLEEIDSKDWSEKEKYWIKKRNSFRPNGYNSTEGGEQPPIHYGNSNFKTKLPDCLINNLYEDLLSYNLTIAELANKYKLSSSQIERINKGQFRRQEGYNFPLRSMKKQQWDVYHIIEDMKKGLSQTELEEKYQIKSRTKLYDISKGKIGKTTNPQKEYPIRKDIVNRTPLYLLNSKNV